MTRRPILLSIIGLTLLTACSGVQVKSPPQPPPLPSHVEISVAPEFKASKKILSGFDALGTCDTWRTGDQVLYGVKLSTEEQIRIWLVLFRLEATTPVCETSSDSKKERIPKEASFRIKDGNGNPVDLSSKLLKIAVEVYDENGKAQGKSSAEVPEAFLRRGFYQACEMGQQTLSAKLDREQTCCVYEAMFALFAFTQIVKDNPILRPILESVVEKPSIFSVLWNLGVDIKVSGDFNKSAQIKSSDGPYSQAPFAFPATFSINDKPALTCNIISLPSKPPLQLGAGIIAMEGINPNANTKKFSLQLLAARCGPQPD